MRTIEKSRERRPSEAAKLIRYNRIERDAQRERAARKKTAER